jgi:hypothetical protein
MGNESEFLFMLKNALEHDDQISVKIVTDTDAEVYIDDYVFRVNVVSDLVA